ncbi:MAG: hypothetical protein ABIG42_04325, partial [bacterium]
MKIKFLLFTSLLLLYLLYCGCSSSSDSPVLPNNDSKTITSEILLSVGVSERFPDGTPAGGIGVLGLFNLSVDHANISADLNSIRQASLTDVLEIV